MAKREYQKTAFYIVPHADDWQLFMQPQASLDIRSEHCKTIFIVTTAGDAGKEEDYWQSREAGMKSSIRFCLAPFQSLSEDRGTTEVANKSIRWWKCNHTKSYFLSLPDGGLEGEGFETNKHQTLIKLLSGEPVGTVDKLASYKNVNELIAVLSALITTETEKNSTPFIHFLHPSADFNPGDHPDHLATGRLLLQVPQLKSSNVLMYRGYSSVNSQEHLKERDLFWKTAVLAVYDHTVYSQSGYSTLGEEPDLYFKWSRAKSASVPMNEKTEIY